MVYVHVPFCLSKCSYCGFYSKVAACGEHEAFLKRLREEAGERLLFPSGFCDTVFVGGGNPTSIGIEGLKTLVSIIGERIDLNKVSEFSFETNPETLSEDVVDFLADIPNIRISMGVQRLNSHDLKILGRNASLNSVHKALKLVFKKISNVNCDFIMGVPSCKSIADELGVFIENYPLKHISAYLLTVEEGTALANLVERGELENPDDIDATELFEVKALLEKNGFAHYEISNYAKQGYQCRHNLGYWEKKDYIGIGPSAVSSLGDRRISNPSDLKAWVNKCEPSVEYLSEADKRNEYVMLRLRLLEKGLDLNMLERLYGKQPSEFYANVEKLLKSVQLLKVGSSLKIPPKSIAFANGIISDLFI